MKPTPGVPYTVVTGDTIRNISRRAYGNDQSDIIVSANYRLLTPRLSKGMSLEGLPYIYEKDVLILPSTTSRYDGRRVTADFDTQLTVLINGLEFRGVKAASIKRGMNTIADGFTFEMPYDYRNRKIVDAVRAFAYQQATLYIGGEPYITGQCMTPANEQSGAGCVCTVEVRTKPGDMIECMSSRKSLEYKKQTLLQIGNDIAARYGLKAFSTHGDSDAFALATKEITDTDFEFLKKLAAQKGFLVTSARDGNLMFTRASPDAKPVAALRAGEAPVKSCRSSFYGSKRFSEWFGFAETSTGLSIVSASRKDAGVTVFRPFAFSADESEAGNIGTAVDWRMAKSLADAVDYGVVVVGWHNPDGQLWEENMKVTFLAPGVQCFRETEFILKSVELGKDVSGGDEATLALILPDAYNMTMPKRPPWEGYPEDKIATPRGPLEAL